MRAPLLAEIKGPDQLRKMIARILHPYGGGVEGFVSESAGRGVIEAREGIEESGDQSVDWCELIKRLRRGPR